MIKNILFDFDGTLADTSEGIVKCMHYTFDKLNVHRATDNMVKELIGAPLEEMLITLLHNDDIDYIMQGVTFFRERYAIHGVYEYDVYPKVNDTLNFLSSKYRLFIVSSKPDIFVKQICEEKCILEYFTDVTGTKVNGNSLSKTERMKMIMDNYNMSINDTIMVGDRPEDVIAAKNNNIECIGMLYGFSNENDLKKSGCSRLCNTFDELISINM